MLLFFIPFRYRFLKFKTNPVCVMHNSLKGNFIKEQKKKKKYNDPRIIIKIAPTFAHLFNHELKIIFALNFILEIDLIPGRERNSATKRCLVRDKSALFQANLFSCISSERERTGRKERMERWPRYCSLYTRGNRAHIKSHDNVPHNADSRALSGIGARISLPVACKTLANLEANVFAGFGGY